MPLKHLHLGVESFGDGVVACVAPHAGDLLGPTLERIAERLERGESAVAELIDAPQQARSQVAALTLRPVLVQQQVAEPLFETVDGVSRVARRSWRGGA